MSEKPAVHVVSCADYEEVRQRLEELLEPFGGAAALAKPGERVVLKANLLMPAAPDKAVTTHPTVVAAVARMVRDCGATPVLADSPGMGFPFNERTLHKLYKTCGLSAIAEEADLELSFDTSARTVSRKEAVLAKRIDVISAVLDADAVINLCKLKTHTFTIMTGAVKNCFGVVSGMGKVGYHSTLPDPARFVRMLLDVADLVAPRLSIMDAVVGMEGDGPGSGQPRPVGRLIASQNPLALDVVASAMMDLSGAQVPLLREAERLARWPWRLDQVQLSGITPEDLPVRGFVPPGTLQNPEAVPWFLQPLLPVVRSAFTVRPAIDESECTACGVCAEACPVDAITMPAMRFARIDQDTCIRCYCCHEMCPTGAVGLHQSFLHRLAYGRRKAS